MTGKKPPAAKKEPETPAAPAKPTPKPAAAAPKPVTPPPAEPNYEAIAEAAGRGAASAIAKAGDRPPTAPKPEDGLNDKQRRTLEVLKRLEVEYKDNIGKAKAYVESVQKANEYRKAWEAQNPGQKFDPDDEAHDEFFKDNDVDWDDEEFADVQALIRAEKVAKQTSDQLAPKLADIDRREALRAAEPAVMGQQINAARGFWSELGEEYAKVLDQTGGIDAAEVQRLNGEDPNRVLAFQRAQIVENFAAELHRLTLVSKDGHPLYPYNPKDEGHKFIAEFIADQEAAMQALPPEQQLDEHGRRFVTADEYYNMTEHRQRYHWRFTDAHLSHIFALKQAQEVKALLAAENEKFEKTASARGYVKNGDGGKVTPPAGGTSVPKPVAATERPTSPASTVEPMVARPGGRGQGSDNPATSSFLNRWLGRG